MSIKAIETVYNGYRFRSRLEARWAVFFDTLGITYEYEKEGFDIDGVRYLPDFWLPELRHWIEIKGQKPTESEIKKAEKLAEQSFNSVHIFYGEIEIPSFGHFYENIYSFDVQDVGPPTHFVVFDHDGSFGWAQCPFCLRIDITYHSSMPALPCECFRYIAPFMANQPLNHLFKHRPDLKMTEPRFEGKFPYYKLNYVPAISRWWGDKTNALIYAGDTPRLIAAYTAARQARFEHGERGKP